MVGEKLWGMVVRSDSGQPMQFELRGIKVPEEKATSQYLVGLNGGLDQAPPTPQMISVASQQLIQISLWCGGRSRFEYQLQSVQIAHQGHQTSSGVRCSVSRLASVLQELLQVWQSQVPQRQMAALEPPAQVPHHLQAASDGHWSVTLRSQFLPKAIGEISERSPGHEWNLRMHSRLLSPGYHSQD